jgi:CubicO group peptidase (beta-lactamase class C family)
MVRFAQMVMAGGALGGKRLLSEAAVREMTSTQIVRFPPSERGYGLGFDTTSKNTGSGPTGKGVFGHGGAWGTRILIDADSQLIKVMVTQTANELPEANLGMVTGAFIDAADKAFKQA